MAEERKNEKRTAPRRRYVWPWFVLAAFLAAIGLAVLWLSVEIDRTRRVRDLNAPAGR
jgi:hypothetical protein